MTNPEIHSLRCRLFFYAVLPCLEILVDRSPKARAMVAKTAFSIGFKTLSGLRTCLSFNHGLCQFLGLRKAAADIELLFLTERQAVRMFEKKVSLAPIPTRGITRLSAIRPFKQLADHMELFLKPQAKDLQEASFRATATEMLLTVALGGVCQLGVHEGYTRECIAQGPQGVVAFYLPDEIRPFWLRLEPEHIEWGRGEPAIPSNVSIRFVDTKTALGALQDTIVSQAEVGLGNIQIEGLIPLADHLSALLERIQLYID